ncbi:hypothetical protein MMC17_008298 [Xylographa soralifera]|nr:hypothetical protein [Xylographa soralifera]
MSNYHGIPHYGGPFNYNSHFPPPIPPQQQVGPYGMMPQTSFPPPRGLPSIPPPQNHQPPHFSNPYNYSTSSPFSHNVAPGSGPPPVLPYSYYANYASHAANGIPPPPFPPIPIPTHNFTPQRPPVSIALPTSPGHYVSPAGLPPRPPSPMESVDKPVDSGTALAAAGNDREDGELSDAEKGHIQNINKSLNSLSPSINYGFPVSPQRYSQVIHTAVVASAAPDLSVNIGNSAATANQKYLEPREDSSKVYIDSNSITEQRICISKAGSHDTDRSSPLKKVEKQDIDSDYQILHGQVKSALLHLHQGQIGFASLLAEGLDASILKGLYHDIGIQVTGGPTKSGSLSPTGQSSLQSTISESILPNDIKPLPESSLSSLATSTSSPNFTRPHKFSGPGSSALEKQSTRSQGIPGSLAVAGPASSEALKGTQSSSHLATASQSAKLNIVGLNKTPAIVASGDRALERKDYIAKMLAAKVGKATALKSPKSVEPAKALKVLPAQGIDPADIVAATTLSDSSLSFSSILPPNTQDDVEAKKKASTDLARRKMEALMSRSIEPNTAPTNRVAVSQTEELLSQIVSPVSREESVRPTGQSSVPPQTQTVEQAIVFSESLSQQYTPATPFFAPLERKSTMGLPGLSMSYPSDSSPTAPRESTSHMDIAAAHQTLPLSTLEQNNRTRSVTPPRPEVSVAQTTTKPTNSIDDRMTGLDAVSTVDIASPVISRKRATAADFIDGPAENMKRRAGSNGHIEVVIEVSDDEGLVEDGDMDIETVVQDSSAEVLHPTGGKSKAIRDLPPLTNFPSRPIASNTAYTNSPAPVQIPGKSGEPKELTQTEEKIRLLKQMIAEKEERQRAKLTSSGAPSPGPTTLRFQNMPIIREPSPTRSSSGSLVLEKKTRALDLVKNELEDQKIVLVAAETAVKGRLEAEETAHASVSARAEAERVEASRATTDTERQYREKRRLALEAALPELDAQIQVARGKLDDISRQRVELEAELQRGSEGRKKIMEELDMLLVALEVDKNMDNALSNEALVRDDGGGLAEVQDSKTNLRDSPARLTGESTILSSIASTISQDMQDDGDQIITETNGLFPRQGSAEEFMDISSVSNDEAQLDELIPIDPVEHHNDTESDFGYDEYEPRLENDLLSQRSAERDNSTRLDNDESLDPFPPSQVQVTLIEQGNVVQELDSLEVDSNSLEDGEISRSISPDEADDSDDYEPPEPQPLVDNRVSQETEMFSPRSPTPQSDNPSKYEVIPESLVPVPELPTVVDHSASGGASHDVSNVRDESLAPLSHKSGHFTPYQSPLNIFTSYRYHPKYVLEVDGGFRSLTYSHKIDPKEPLCRWELAGGTCNDDSCKYQHFRSMSLTDDMILVQLGSIHEGSSLEEKNAYVSGLKQIIHDMRSRRVTDFNTVAQEITAYRASFLGDSSRILTL